MDIWTIDIYIDMYVYNIKQKELQNIQYLNLGNFTDETKKLCPSQCLSS